MRAIWSGSLSFGLVNIPVRLYSASRERPLSFKLLDKKDHAPVGYKKIRRTDEKEVAQKDIVKGFEVEKGEFVILEPDDFRKASPKKTQTIEIVQFADAGDIDPMYFERPYYIEPDPKATKAYGLLRDALSNVGKAGVAQFVLHDRAHLGLIMAHDDILLLQQMRYKDELREPDIHTPSSVEYGKKEMDLALSLINTLSGRFDPAAFKDTYTDDLKRIIEAKAKGKRIVVAQGEEPITTSTADILKALQQSLEQEPEPIAHGTKRVQKKKKLHKNRRT